MRRFLLSLLLVCGVVAWSGGVAAETVYRSGVHYPWRFARVSDPHWGWAGAGSPLRNWGALRAVEDTLNTIGIDFLLISGDWSWNGRLSSNAEHCADSLAVWLARKDFPVYACLGNHEADTADTLLHRNPYHNAKAAYPDWMPGATGDVNWWKLDHKGYRFIFVQNNSEFGGACNAETQCYGNNNPSYGVRHHEDYDGITVPTSAQRLAIASWTSAASRQGRRLFVVGHRHIYGSNHAAVTRPNQPQGRGTGFIKAVEDSLGAHERGVFLGGDQHIPMWDNWAICDSAAAVAGGRGLYHCMSDMSGNSRSADSTTSVDIAASQLQAWSFFDSDEYASGYRVDGGAPFYPDKIINEASSLFEDPGCDHVFTWELYTVYGDYVLLEVFRVWTADSEGWTHYPGSGHHTRINWNTLTLDAR